MVMVESIKESSNKHQYEMLMEAKKVWYLIKNEVFSDPRNSHLRRASSIVGD